MAEARSDIADEVRPAFDQAGFEHLTARVQDGVISRRQLLELHARPHQIRRMLRRRELTVVHPGVYVNHTGPLTWDQRAWAAVLYAWPAALARESALPKPPAKGPIHVAVALGRNLKRVPGVVIHRTAELEARTHPTQVPPRLTIEHAAIDLALTKRDLAAKFTVFADACQTRQTTAARIAEALRTRSRVPDKYLMLDLLDDLERGASSVLEREYFRLERLHGLPEAKRQAAGMVDGKRIYRDASYEEYAVDVELDGRPFHDNAAARNSDFARDLENSVSSERLTVRLTYGQVHSRGCQTIRHIATLLERRGWTGPFERCPDCPSV